ncbi:MAG: hypothetical protein QXR60_02325 [Candidatus Nanoarchaeia archaeon]
MRCKKKGFVSTGEAAEILGISRSTVSRKFDGFGRRPKYRLEGKVNPLTGERSLSLESVMAVVKAFKVEVPDAIVRKYNLSDYLK